MSNTYPEASHVGALGDVQVGISISELFLQMAPLIRYRKGPDIKAVEVTVPVEYRRTLTLQLGRALQYDQTPLRTAEENAQLKQLLGQIAEIGRQQTPGSKLRKYATTTLCDALNDDGTSIQAETAGLLREWAEPEALDDLQRAWNGDSNQDHLRKFRLPSNDALPIITTMKDIVARHPDFLLTREQREIVDMKFAY